MLQRLAWVAATLLLAACSGMPTAGDVEPPLGPPLERFAAEGRISLRQGERSDHLQFDWQHAPGRDVVLFSTPLGQGLAELGHDGGAAWLKQAGRPELRADGLPALTAQLFGTPLPLEALAGWLGGAQPDQRGEVDGWHIEVVEVAPYRQHRLPRRVDVRRDDIELRIVVTEWRE